jgi:hypothetical protein
MKDYQKKGRFARERIDPQHEARYANYSKVGHNAYEFFIGFGHHDANIHHAAPYTRIIASPAYIRMLLRPLSNAVAQHEKKFCRLEE